MSAPLTLVVPMPPNLANARMHWREKNRERRAYFDRMDMLCIARQLPQPPPVPFPRVCIGATLFLGAHMDDDNAMARIKWPVDWLRTRGYIRDDRRTHCRFTMPAQVVKRDGNYRIELTVTPVEESR